MTKYPQLKLENQLCFPLYACSKEIVRRYGPVLEPYNLTYTQYLVMVVLWEKEEVKVSELGKLLLLDSGTLTPVLKKLEANGYVKRTRLKDDERCVVVRLTALGCDLQDKIADVPGKVCGCVNLPKEDMQRLHELLLKVLKCI